MAKLLEGKFVAEKIKQEIRAQVQGLKKPPVLVSVWVGDNPGAATYARSQAKTAEALGIVYKPFNLDQDITEDALIDFVLKLNTDKAVNGIIVQMPVPQHIDYKKICEFISPLKDVEGMHPANIGKLIFGRSRIIACTANAIMELLNSTGVDLYGKEVVIVGHSEIVHRRCVTDQRLSSRLPGRQYPDRRPRGCCRCNEKYSHLTSRADTRSF